ncbi:MAG: hypothetical protein ABWX96_01370 [Propionibacteriaceae bacterium]
MIRSHSPTTTQTVEMQQIAELNTTLGIHPMPVITALDLGLAGTPLPSRGRGVGLPSTARIMWVCWDGPPEFPYLHGHFAAEGSQESVLHVDLHTAALRELSRRLKLRHVWGSGSTTD